MTFFSSGIGPADWLNSATLVTVGLIAGIAGILGVVLPWLRDRKKPDPIVAWQQQTEELRDLLTRQSDAEINRLVAQLAAKDRDIRYWQRRAMEANPTDD